jgi:hypothetical protein
MEIEIDSPYSLGKLIEWKLSGHTFLPFCFRKAPYSLGKLIEWKLGIEPFQSSTLSEFQPPYSLGKLIEWKRIFGNHRRQNLI